MSRHFGRNNRNNYSNNNYNNNYSNSNRKSIRNVQNNRDNSDKKEKYKKWNGEQINMIYDSIDISRHNYSVIKDTDEGRESNNTLIPGLSPIISDKYYFSPNYAGKNCFLIFTKVFGRYFASIIDRKNLAYSIGNVDLEKVRVRYVNVQADIDLYEGTIFDGVYYDFNNTRAFTITDVFLYKGIDYTNTDLKVKLSEMRSYFNRMGTYTNNIKNKMRSNIDIDIIVNKVHEIEGDTFRNIIEQIPNKDQSGAAMRGICFYKAKSGTRLIFNFKSYKSDFMNNNTSHIKTNSDNNINTNNSNNNRSVDTTSKLELNGNVVDINNLTSSAQPRLLKRYYMVRDDVDPNEKITATLKMDMTSQSDVYSMYTYEKIGKKKIKYIKMDIAYISDKEKSEWVRECFTDNVMTKNGVQYLFMKCKWNNDANKWEPYKVNTKVRLPTSYSKISEKLMMVEEDDSDSEY